METGCATVAKNLSLWRKSTHESCLKASRRRAWRSCNRCRVGQSKKMSEHNERREYALVDTDKLPAGPYPYLFVNADGSARELHPKEREHLETPFHPAD